MGSISEEQYRMMLLKTEQNKHREAQPIPESAVTQESKLHEQIIQECRQRGWLYFHGSMAHRTHRIAGEFDFVILADKGRVLFVECKTKTGKLSLDQEGIFAWARKLQHTPHLVRSIEEFLEIAKTP